MVRVQFLGHAAFAVFRSEGQVVLVDPWFTHNPSASAKAEDFARVDQVLLTHDHDDHLGDTVEICRRTGATLVAVFETAERLGADGLQVEPMSIGGGIDVDGMRINMVNAQHSSGEGHPAGFVVEVDGKNLYFAGDTGLFRDMKTIAELWELDLAVLPTGDRFTMGPAHAARAVEWLKAKHVIPCHYGTFPIILPDAREFIRLVGDRAQVHALAAGETLELE
ncbi:MAG: metal-dependent hydrolase [Gemmatimonadetes bacterium]|nr:metal-dependent hydrolase [Gemmatimonadota bacterium]